jgi:arylsulfatase A-like enzyme
VSEAIVELMDAGATLVELAGAELPGDSYARSITSVLQEPSRPHRGLALSEFSGEAMVASTDWKLAVNSDGDVYLLYDLRADPFDTHNLAALPKYEQIEREYRRYLRETVEANP